MIISKKKYYNLIDDLQETENELKEYKEKYDFLKDKLSRKEKAYLKEYDYAILVKDYKTKIWNQGKFEEKVREVHFSQESHINVPEIIIRK